MARLVEVYHRGGDTVYNNWSVRETEINPAHVIKLTEDELMKEYLVKGYLPKDLAKNISFTRVNLVNGLNPVIVGSISQVMEKLQATGKQLLHG